MTKYFATKEGRFSFSAEVSLFDLQDADRCGDEPRAVYIPVAISVSDTASSEDVAAVYADIAFSESDSDFDAATEIEWAGPKCLRDLSRDEQEAALEDAYRGADKIINAVAKAIEPAARKALGEA